MSHVLCKEWSCCPQNVCVCFTLLWNVHPTRSIFQNKSPNNPWDGIPKRSQWDYHRTAEKRPGVVVPGGSVWGGSPMAVPLVVYGICIYQQSQSLRCQFRVWRLGRVDAPVTSAMGRRFYHLHVTPGNIYTPWNGPMVTWRMTPSSEDHEIHEPNRWCHPRNHVSSRESIYTY